MRQTLDRLELTGQQLQQQKQRKPSGANAVQPLPGSLPIKQQANMRGVPKANQQPSSSVGASTDDDTLTDSQIYGSRQPQPKDMGIFGPQGSTRRQDADRHYQSFQGPSLSKGPYTPDPNGPVRPMPLGTQESFAQLGVDGSDYYNMQSGNVSPREWEGIKANAIHAQREKFNTITPQRQQQLDADIAMDREIATKNAADSQRSLGFTGAIKNEDYVSGLNRQADDYGQRRQSADAMNKHLDNGGGLQYRQASTGFGTSEQTAQAAADYRGMSAADQARKEAFNSEYDATIQSTRAQRDARDAAQREQGIDPDAARRDINRLSSQFAAITKQKVSPGYRFVDFVQDELASGRLSPDKAKDAIGIIESNYDHKFDLTQPERTGPSIQAPSALDMARQKHADRQDMLQQARDYGMQQRQLIAAQQGRDRSNEARLIAQGASVQSAANAVGRQNAVGDAYGQQRAMGQDKLMADIAMNQADVYQRDLADARRYKDREAQRLYDAENPKQTAAPKSSTTGTKATGGTQQPPPAEQPKSSDKKQVSNSKQLSPKIQSSIDSLNDPKNKFRANDPGSLAQAAQHLDSQGLSPAEHAQALGKIYDTDFSDPTVAEGTIKNINAHAEKEAKAQDRWSDKQGDNRRRVDSIVENHIPALRAIARASALTPERVAELAFPEKFGNIYDPFLPERRQKLIDALSAQENQGESEND